MEKQIQRARSLPVTRFNSWVHFKLMDAMEKGPSSVRPKNDNFDNHDGDDGVLTAMTMMKVGWSKRHSHHRILMPDRGEVQPRGWRRELWGWRLGKGEVAAEIDGVLWGGGVTGDMLGEGKRKSESLQCTRA